MKFSLRSACILLKTSSIFMVALFTFIGSANAATTPSLGVASTFGVLSNTLTSTTIPNGATIFGDAGYTTTSGVSVFVSGATHVNDATYAQAGADQHTALSALNSQPCTFTFSGTVDLATDISHGALGVYTPGVYCSTGSMSIGGGGTVTLDGVGTYIFRPSGTLSTSDFSQVTTINDASACDVFWTPKMPTPFVATALGSDTKFVGTVIEPAGAANSDITVGGGTKWVGRALAFDWNITTNPIIMKYVQITAPTCSVPPPPEPVSATLHIIKHVVNNDDGTATASSFTLHVTVATGMGIADVAGSPTAGVESPGTAYTLSSGTYTVSEDAFSGYTSSISGDCDVSGNVTVASGDSKTCTITNDDIPKKVPPPLTSTTTLHVIKKVLNDNAGTAVASDAVIHVKNGSGDVAESPQAGSGSPGTLYTLNADTYEVSEDTFAGYTSSISGDCDVNGKVTLATGDDKTCTITNDDIAGTKVPPSTKLPILHIIKHVVNDDGGTAVSSIFTMHVKSSGFFSTTEITGSPTAGAEAPGTSYTLSPGTYKVSEGPIGGYTAHLSGDCDANGKIELAFGDDKTCTITNDDTAKTTVIPKLPNTGIASWFVDSVTWATFGLWDKIMSVFSFFSPTPAERGISLEKIPAPTNADVSVVGFPAHLKIPKIGVDTSFEYTGLKQDGAMEGPSTISSVGWYKDSVRPGEKGDAVITGHLVQIRGGKVTKSGVFNDLSKLIPGDEVTVEDTRGLSTTFIVRELRRYDPDAIATDVFTSEDGNHLNLITCDGVWDSEKKSYSERLVVFTNRKVE